MYEEQVADQSNSRSFSSAPVSPNVRERPILFSAPMVRAILDGSKTQTRRVITPQPNLLNGRFEYSGDAKDAWPDQSVWVGYTPSGKFGVCVPPFFKCPFGRVGDRLWVRETWNGTQGEGIAYRATDPHMNGEPWKPSIHMPRKVSRITLEITEIRVQRLQNISDEEAVAEGVGIHFPTHEFKMLWDSINGKKHPWASNPWVFAITFRNLSGTPTNK